jgi:hypothetical protein
MRQKQASHIRERQPIYEPLALTIAIRRRHNLLGFWLVRRTPTGTRALV